MIEEILLEYEPIKSENRELTQGMFQLYIEQPSRIKIAEAVVVTPFEKAAKESGQEEFIFDNLRIGVSKRERKDTKWKEAYQKIKTYLDIRADDVKAESMKSGNLKNFNGIGYCISVDELITHIDSAVEEFTNLSSWVQIEWPRKRKNEEYNRTLVIPSRNYSSINQHNAEIALAAKRFCAGIKEEVIDSFKKANKEWFEAETTYNNEDKIPGKEDSPVHMLRTIGKNKHVYIGLVREENPNYKDIVAILRGELSAIRNSDANMQDHYRTKRENKNVFVNIKNTIERLNWLHNSNTKVEARYEIVP